MLWTWLALRLLLLLLLLLPLAWGHGTCVHRTVACSEPTRCMGVSMDGCNSESSNHCLRPLLAKLVAGYNALRSSTQPQHICEHALQITSTRLVLP